MLKFQAFPISDVFVAGRVSEMCIFNRSNTLSERSDLSNSVNATINVLKVTSRIPDMDSTHPTKSGTLQTL